MLLPLKNSATDRHSLLAACLTLGLTFFCLFARLTAEPAPAPSQKQLADSMDRKITAIRENAAKERPARQSLVFSQDEINAYFAERRLPMPEGVRSVTFDLSSNQVRSRSRIDFDDITRERRSRNPLMYFFTGLHDVEVVAQVPSSRAGMAHVTVESVAIDGIEVPRMALQFFVERYVNPKYPNVGLDRDYRLPSHLDTVVIASRKGTVTQK